MTIEVGSSLDESAQDQSCIQYWTKMDFPEDFSDDHCSTRAQTVFCLVVVSGTIDLDGDLGTAISTPTLWCKGALHVQSSLLQYPTLLSPWRQNHATSMMC